MTAIDHMIANYDSFLLAAKNCLHNHHLAEDMVAEMCVTAVRHPEMNTGVIFKSRLCDFLRRKIGHRRMIRSVGDFSENARVDPDLMSGRCDTPDQIAAWREARGLALDMLHKLPPVDRHIMMGFFSGKPHKVFVLGERRASTICRRPAHRVEPYQGSSLEGA